MPSYRKKSPATEGKRKTRASDKARTSPRKSKKSKSASLNDGSYLQLPDPQQAPVSTVVSHAQPQISASTGQAILDMLNKLDASNQELTRRMDRFECNGSVSSTPLTSPTIPPVNHAHARGSQQVAVPPHLLQQPISGTSTTRNTDTHVLGTTQPQPSAASNDIRDAVAHKVDILRSIPSISSAVSQLLASYDQQVDREVMQGKSTVIRKKSGRYNTTDTTSLGPQFRWPNEGLIAASHLKRPTYNDLNLAEWVSGQLILLIEDQLLLRNMLTQLAASTRDAVSLPWPVIRSAWAVSMTDVEEGRLSWGIRCSGH